MKKSQTRKQRLLRRLYTLDTIGMLAVCFFVVNYLIYPEALDYIRLVVDQGDGMMGRGDFQGHFGACLRDPQGRLVVGVVEIGIGALKAMIILALYHASANYLYRLSHIGILTRLNWPLLFGAGIYLMHLVTLFTMLVIYPDQYNLIMYWSVLFNHLSLLIAAILAAILIICAGLVIYKYRRVIRRRVNTSLHLFRNR